MTRRAKIMTSIAMIFTSVNFFWMLYWAMKHGATAFPDGIHDDTGYYVIEHGKRVNFSPPDFYWSYWQAIITAAAFAATGILIFSLYAKREIIET